MFIQTLTYARVLFIQTCYDRCTSVYGVGLRPREPRAHEINVTRRVLRATHTFGVLAIPGPGGFRSHQLQLLLLRLQLLAAAEAARDDAVAAASGTERLIRFLSCIFVRAIFSRVELRPRIVSTIHGLK